MWAPLEEGWHCPALPGTSPRARSLGPSSPPSDSALLTPTELQLWGLTELSASRECSCLSNSL